MSPAELRKPPSGKGYVFTIKGVSWYEKKPDPPSQFIEDNFVSLLKQWTVEVDGRRFDLGRMGITYAALMDFDSQLAELAPNVKADTSVGPRMRGGRRPMPNPMGTSPMFGSSPMSSGPTLSGTTPSGAAEGKEVKTLTQTLFTVQFVYQPVLKDRKDEDPRKAEPAKK